MPTESIHIRLANMDDLLPIQQCAKQAYSKYVARMQREPAPMQANFADQISRQVVSIALADETIAGFVVFYERDNHMHLENVAVLPSYANRGIGKHLIEHVEKKTISAGLSAVELYTNEAMHENFGLYLHLGYTETDRRTDDGFHRVFYSKLLN